MCDTHGITTAVGKIYPAHCRSRAISEADLTISAAADLNKSMTGTVPASATKKQLHTKILKKLLSILENGKPPRVANVGQTRVSPAASTSTDATSPRVIAGTRFVHQRQTRNNTPLPSIREEEDMTEATQIGEEIQHGTPDGTVEERLEEGKDPIPHYVEDVQEMLKEAQPVQPVRKNPV